MTKKELFKKAHEMTREVLREFPDADYRVQLSICLKELYKQMVKDNESNKQDKVEDRKVDVNMDKMLKAQTVTINGFERSVAIKITGERMIGVINKSRFIWDYTKHEVPHVEVKEGGNKIKAAKYGRLFILARLKMANVVLPIKTKETTVKYIHIDNKDGVWLNCFENGYIRGEVNGVPFVWNPTAHKYAAVVNTPGFKGGITNTIDTSLIKKRLIDAGYRTPNQLKAAIQEQSQCEAV